MRKQFGLALVAVAWLWSMPARGQDIKETLQTLPDESLAVVLTSKLDRLDDKIQVVIKKLQIPLPLTALELGKAAVGISKGLNSKGSAAVALVMNDELGSPAAVFFLPVSDYGEFVGQFKAAAKGIVDIELVDGRKMTVAKKGNFALLVEPRNADVLKKVLASKSNLTGWAEPIQDWLEENEVTLLATPRGVKKAVAAAREGLSRSREDAGKKEELDFVQGWLKGTDSFLKSLDTDLTHAGIGIRVDKAGNVLVDGRGNFAKGSNLAKAAGELKGLSGGPVGSLPGGPFAMAFGGAIPPSFMEAMMKLNLEVMKAINKDGDKLKEKFAKLDKIFAETSKGLQGMAFVLRTGKENAPLFGNMVGFMRLDDSAAYLESYEKMVPELNALYKELGTPFLPQVELKKKKIAGVTILEIETAMPINDDPMQKKIMEAMFGPGGKMKSSVAAFDAKTILMTYSSAEGLVDTVKELAGKGLKDDPEVTRTMSLLPEGAQWALLFHPRGMAEMTAQWMKTFAPNVPVQIPELPKTPPVGIGVRASETGVTLQIVVPSQIFEAIGQLIGGQKGT